MKFTVQKDDIMKGFAAVSKAVPRKSYNPILERVRMEARASNTVILRGTNAEVDITYRVPAEVEKSGSCCVDPIVFTTIGLYQPGKIRLSLRKQLSLSQKGRRHRFAVISADSYPQAPTLEAYKPVDVQALGAALTRCGISVSSAADRPILQTVYCDPLRNYMVGSDGNQVSTYSIDLRGSIVTPPMRSLSILLPLLKTVEEVEVCFNSWAGFRSDEWEVLVNSIAGEPFQGKALDAVLRAEEGKPVKRLVVLKDEIQAALEICALHSDRAWSMDKNYYVKLSSTEKGTSLEMQVPDVSEIEERLTVVEAEGEDFEILLHPALLLEGVGVVQSAEVEFLFYGSRQPFLVIDREDPKFRYLQVAMAMGPSPDTPSEEVEEETPVSPKPVEKKEVPTDQSGDEAEPWPEPDEEDF